ncbi:Polypeptide-transport-associated domain protein FtsQ-type [Rhodomicrobium vannielii ATCC 17100]|uniref:Cell division protein FtsQ n=1 Tax=Rhodomicrobium vannielii (strain ATCC 17100 / DSM 162 / LMG 4299 / NCIMB 10020 / ATH 3.1.1) TaxID=648757 RepID=E3I236_RHOVT|nr:Polypeptide-transport-associated domain protein FtsQ-type [Rhodomicrobium vannielii ATCC 17100]
MQSLVSGTVSAKGPGIGAAQPGKDAAAAPSLFRFELAHADRAARAGFVVSMVFLVATAIYGLYLSGATKSLFDEVSTFADKAAYDAGFRLEDLAVSGSDNTPKETLLKALQLPFEHSSLSYDAAEAHDRLIALGWIKTAEVRRVLPSRLEVVLTEREPYARWKDAAGVVQVVDREGRVLGPSEGQFETLLLFSGEGAPAEAAAFIESLADRETIRSRVAEASFVAERFWQVKLDSGVTLKLPRKVGELTFSKLESVLANSKIAEMALDTIDLRLTHRTILQLREPTTANRDKAIALLTSAPASQPAMPPRRGKAL